MIGNFCVIGKTNEWHYYYTSLERALGWVKAQKHPEDYEIWCNGKRYY